MTLTEASNSFLRWKEQKQKECPQLHYWSATLIFNSPYWCLLDEYVRGILLHTFLRFSKFSHAFLHLTIIIMLVGCRYICVVWSFYKRHIRILQHTFTKVGLLFWKQKGFSHWLGLIMHISKAINASKVMEVRISFFIIV